MNLQVLGDLYNGLFANQTSNPELYVEYELWTTIVDRLPDDYQMPDQPLLQPMND